MHSEAAKVRDAVRLTELVEPQRAGTLAVDLDDHAADLLRLALRALDLIANCFRVARMASAEKRLGVLVVEELDEKANIVGRGPAQRDHVGSLAGTSVRRRWIPVPSATPPRISPSPPSAAAPMCSPRKSAP